MKNNKYFSFLLFGLGVLVGGFMMGDYGSLVFAGDKTGDNINYEEKKKIEYMTEAKNVAYPVKVDESTLSKIYEASFGRPLDEEGKNFHIGKDLNQVLNDINSSDERRYYSALFKAVKAYEEAVRAPGTLTPEDKQRYIDNINSALATLLAWVETLPERDICRGVVGIIEARQAIQEAYDKMSPAAKEAAQKGVFKALESLPKDQPLPSKRCIIGTPGITPPPPEPPIQQYTPDSPVSL